MVIVLDANILVSAFLSDKGEDAKVVREAKEQELYLSPFILQEVYTSLHYPRIRKRFDYPDANIDNYLVGLTKACTLIEATIKLDVSPDPKDNPVLACAVAAEADYLVTRNIKHFPDEHAGVQVIHPRKFLATLNQ